MPTVRKPHANSVHRRGGTTQASPTPPGARGGGADTKGPVDHTSPRGNKSGGGGHGEGGGRYGGGARAARRVATSQPSPTRPVTRAAAANANGTVNPT